MERLKDRKTNSRIGDVSPPSPAFLQHRHRHRHTHSLSLLAQPCSETCSGPRLGVGRQQAPVGDTHTYIELNLAPLGANTPQRVAEPISASLPAPGGLTSPSERMW